MKSSILTRSLLLGAALSLSACGVFGGGNKKPRTPVLGERLPVLAYEGVAEADPALASVPVTVPAPVANSSWGQPGGNAEKSPGNLELATSPRRVWEVSIGRGSSKKARLGSGPVVDAGKVFTIDTEATVRAFDARNGSTLWSRRLTAPDGEVRAAFGGGVSVSEGRVYATSGLGVVSAFDVASGNRLWEVRLGVPLRGAPAVAGGQIFVVSQDNQLFALSTADGATEWDMAATVEVAGLFGTATPAVAQGTVVAGFSSGELIALRVENGRVVWQDALVRTGINTTVGNLSDVDASPAIDGGRVFAVGKGGRMAVLDLASGQRVWEANLAGTSTPVPAGDWVYVVTDEAKLVCLSRATGKIRWIAALPAWKDPKDKKGPITWVGPVLASGRLLLLNSQGQMASVSAIDGKVESRTNLSSGTHLPPVVADRTLYILNEEGRLSAWR